MLSSIAAHVAIIVFVSVNIVVAITDLKSMKIGNGLILVLLVSYLVCAPLAGLSFDAMATSGLMALCTLVVASILFGFGWIGGGDAKLVAVTSLWMGSYATHEYLVTAAIIGLGLTCAVMIARSYRTVLAPHWPLSAKILMKGEGVPYGVALAASALMTISNTFWVP